jgi:hypothetical protein
LTLTDQVLHFTFESAVGLLIIFYSLPVDAKIKLKKGKRLPAINWHISIFAAPSVDWICLFKRPDNYRDRGGDRTTIVTEGARACGWPAPPAGGAN